MMLAGWNLVLGNCGYPQKSPLLWSRRNQCSFRWWLLCSPGLYMTTVEYTDPHKKYTIVIRNSWMKRLRTCQCMSYPTCPSHKDQCMFRNATLYFLKWKILTTLGKGSWRGWCNLTPTFAPVSTPGGQHRLPGAHGHSLPAPILGSTFSHYC